MTSCAARLAPTAEPDGLVAPLPEFSFAFQPIVDTRQRIVVSQEALVRGPDGASAGEVFAQIAASDLHRFDRAARGVAVALAARLGIDCSLNLNFLPRSLAADDRAVRSTLEAAARHGLSVDRLILEVTESEVIDDSAAFAALINSYREDGLRLAIDDFGAGYSGLNLLADFQPDIVKLDMRLIRGIERHGPRQAIVRGIILTCTDLGIDIVAEGVETADELHWLEDDGVYLFQGYLLATPEFEQLAVPRYPARD